MGDVKVQRGSTTLTATETSKAVTITAVGSLSSAFARVLNVAHVSASSSSKYHEEHGATVELTGTSTLTIKRTAGSGSLTVTWEIWEYTGAAGGANEFVVLGQGEQAMTATTGSITHTAGTTLSDIVPVLTGMRIGDGLSLASQSDRVMARIQRNTLSSTDLARYDASTDINISYAIVEFTGSAWGVQEVTGTTSAATNTWSLGSAVSAWSKAFILASWRTDGGTGMDDVLMMFWPGTTSQIKSHVSVSSRTMDFAAYIIEHADLSVEHNDTIDGTAPTGDLTIDITVTAPTDYLNSTGLIGYAAPTYVYSDINRGFLDYTLTTSTNWRFTHTASNGGNNPDLAIQVIDFDGLVSGTTYDGVVSAAGGATATVTGTQWGNGQATAAGEGGVSATASRIIDGQATASGGAGVGVTASKILKGQMAASGTASATATGSGTLGGTISASGAGGVSATASRILGVAASASGAVEVAATASKILYGAASMSGAAGMSAVATKAVSGQVGASGAGAVAVTANEISNASVTASGGVGATVAGSATVVAAAAATASGTGSVTGSAIRGGGGVVEGSGGVTATATKIVAGTIPATGSVSVTVIGTEATAAAVHASPSVSASVTASAVLTGGAATTGEVALVATGLVTVAGEMTASGTVDVSVTAGRIVAGSVGAGGNSDVSAIGVRTSPGDATVSASFTASASVTATYDAVGTADISGEISLSASGTTDPVTVITMTVNNMIERIRTYVDGVYGPGEIDILASAINASDTTIIASIPAKGLRIGAYIEIDDEIMRVIGVTNSNISVLRGQRDTAAVSHDANSVINVSPHFTRKELLDSVKEEILSWPDSLFQTNTTTFTVSATDNTYVYDPIGISGEDEVFIRPLELIAYPDNGEGPTIYPPFDIDLGHASFTSNIALLLRDKRSGYATHRFTYAKRFNLDNFTYTTNFEQDVGLSGSMTEIIYYGVMARLLVGHEVKRLSRRAQGQARNAREIPATSNLQATGGFRALRKQAIGEEKKRLIRQWPIRMRR